MALDPNELAKLKADLLADLKAALKSDIVPMMAALAKDAVGAASPVAAVVADPVIDIVDSYVMSMLGTPAPANAVPAPTDTQSQINQIAQHVAALTVATGKSGSLSLKVGAVPATVAAPSVQ
jgi:hypothetical protein